MNALTELTGLGLRPCPNPILVQSPTFADAWKTTDRGSWLAWYLDRVLSRLTEEEQARAIAAIDRCVELVGSNRNHERYKMAQARHTAHMLESRLLWVQHCDGRPTPEIQHMFATVIRQEFPAHPVPAR